MADKRLLGGVARAQSDSDPRESLVREVDYTVKWNALIVHE
jgi:hypothetical protein